MNRWRRAAVIVGIAVLPACTSVWTSRHYQQVAWADGDGSRVEVWLRQGTMPMPYWVVALDVMATPVMLVAELNFAVAAWRSEQHDIEGGAFGFVASLLPTVTCVPLDNKNSVRFPLSEPLALPASARAELAALGGIAGSEWLLKQYAAKYPDQAERYAHSVAYLVSRVRLAPALNE